MYILVQLDERVYNTQCHVNFQIDLDKDSKLYDMTKLLKCRDKIETLISKELTNCLKSNQKTPHPVPSDYYVTGI